MEKKRILLVDDEEGIQLLYREEFEEEGFEVITAYNGEEALENPYAAHMSSALTW